MTLSVRSIFPQAVGRAILAFSTFASCADNTSVVASPPLGNFAAGAVMLSEPKPKNVFSEKEKELVRQNYGNPAMAVKTLDPRWIVDEKDIALAMKEKNTPFSDFVTRNSTFPVNPDTKRFFVENLGSSYSSGFSRNSNHKFDLGHYIQLIKDNPDVTAWYYLAQKDSCPVNGNWVREIVWSKPETLFARGAVRNKNYKILEGDKTFARKNQITDVAGVLASKEDYVPEKADSKAMLEKGALREEWALDSQFTYQLALKESTEITEEHIEAARQYRNHMIATVASHPKYLKGRSEESIQKDIDLAFSNPNGIFAQELFFNPEINLTLEIINKVTQKEFRDKRIAEAIAQHKNFPINNDWTESMQSEGFRNTYLACGYAQNDRLPITDENLQFAMDNPNSKWAFGFMQNENVPITSEILDFADSHGGTNFATGLMQHKDFDKARERIFRAKTYGIDVKIPNVTDSNFEKEVIKSKTPVVVDFWADWCSTCHQFSPTLQTLANDFGDNLKITKLNTDNNPEKTGQYEIGVWPSIALFKDGEVVEWLSSADSKFTIASKIQQHLNK